MARKRRKRTGRRPTAAEKGISEMRGLLAQIVDLVAEIEGSVAELQQETHRRSDAARRANQTRRGITTDVPWDEDTVLCIVPDFGETH